MSVLGTPGGSCGAFCANVPVPAPQPTAKAMLAAPPNSANALLISDFMDFPFSSSIAKAYPVVAPIIGPDHCTGMNAR